MAKRRKRTSSKIHVERAMKDIRVLHREHLRRISAILTNALGFAVRVTPVRAAEKPEAPPARKRKKAAVDRVVGHVAGYGEDSLAPAEVTASANPPDDGVGF